MNDWKTAQAAEDAAAKRTELENVDAAIVVVEGHLAAAQSFEGYYREQLAAVERQIGEIATAVRARADGWTIVRSPNEAGAAELTRLYGVRGALEREIAEHKAAKTTVSDGGWGRTIKYCSLSVSDATRRLHHLRIVRDRAAEQLADLKSRCTPGELVQAGSPAPDYEAYRARAEELRNGRFVVRGGAA